MAGGSRSQTRLDFREVSFRPAEQGTPDARNNQQKSSTNTKPQSTMEKGINGSQHQIKLRARHATGPTQVTLKDRESERVLAMQPGCVVSRSRSGWLPPWWFGNLAAFIALAVQISISLLGRTFRLVRCNLLPLLPILSSILLLSLLLDWRSSRDWCPVWLRSSCQWCGGRSVDKVVDLGTTWPRQHWSSLMRVWCSWLAHRMHDLVTQREQNGASAKAAMKMQMTVESHVCTFSPLKASVQSLAKNGARHFKSSRRQTPKRHVKSSGPKPFFPLVLMWPDWARVTFAASVILRY